MFPGRPVEKVTRESSGFPVCVDGTVVVGTRAMLSVPWPDRVRLVAAVQFDYELVRPDFRARERAFQVLSELGARAAKARLVVQVRRPDDPAVEYAFEQDPVGFLDTELESRREAGFPPWRRLAIVEVRGPTRGSVLTHARRVTKCLEAVRGVETVGPVDVARGGVRFLVKYPRGRKFGTILDRALLRRGKAETRVDVDPYEAT
jgi:primosomal protein N' (replication factor Y)